MYIPVAKVAEIPPGTMKAVDAGGKQILVANVGGSFFAMQRKCPHLMLWTALNRRR